MVRPAVQQRHGHPGQRRHARTRRGPAGGRLHASAGAAVSAAAVDGWRASRRAARPDDADRGASNGRVRATTSTGRSFSTSPTCVHLPLYVEDAFHGDSRNGPYGAAVHAIDWATGVLLDDSTPSARRRHDRHLHQRQWSARPSGRGQQRPAPWQQGAHHGGRNAGPGHHPLAGCCAGRGRARRTDHGDGPPADARPMVGHAVLDDVVIDGHDITDVVIDGATSPYETFAASTAHRSTRFATTATSFGSTTRRAARRRHRALRPRRRHR